jgi:serine/threonine-protein kinase
MIGRKLGHYEIVEKIGEGGMGAVYRARDTKLGRDVALKLLPDFLAGDRERITRLEREAHLLASLNHPNIATLHGLEESQGLKYLVMELVPGETLDDRISRAPLRLEECLGILRQIAEALEAAHEKGIIHRDLKPANVVVTSEGRVKVLDFGLAKAVAQEAPKSDLSKSPTLTREGTEHGVILGTASYMSPEQARGKSLDRRTDIWSFGCVFYEALTGRKALSGDTVSDTIAAILEKEPDWSALPARTPPKIRDLLRRCLQKEPHRRLRDIGDARIEIEEALTEPSAAPVAGPPRRYLPWAVAALVSAIALWSLMRPGAEPVREVSRLTVTVPVEQALAWRNDPSVAVSPDGRRLVYVGGPGGERRLFLRRLDQNEAVPIPGTEGATTAFFSPDGRSVGFYSSFGKLQRVLLDSGLPVALADTPDPWGASWGPGDVILFSPDGSGLSRISASGGVPSIVTTPNAAQGETSHRWPEILPDGKTALFTIRTASGGFRIAVLSLQNGEYRVLFERGTFARYIPTGHLVYMSEGALSAVAFDLERLELAGEPFRLHQAVWTNLPNGTAHFAISLDGTLVYVPPFEAQNTLVWVDRAGVVRPITETRRGFAEPRLSPDGERLAVSISEVGQTHIWTYDIARDSFLRLTFGPNDEGAPVWTPDGNRATFYRGYNIFWIPADGSGPEERLTTSENSQTPLSWSADGKVLLYQEQGPETARDLWLLTLPERTTRPFVPTPFDEAGGRFSPDGRFLAYRSNESGRNEVYLRPFPGPGSKWQISTEGGSQAVWARSGREIFYRSGDKMMAVSIETEPVFRAGRPVLLFEGKFQYPGVTISQYDVAADGQHFVMVKEDEPWPTQIHVVQNWFEELKKLVPAR